MGHLYKPRLIGQYDFGEAASALQKMLRRGLEDQALFWAVELYNSGFGNYVWRRLKIIASEDVGLADPMVCVQVRTLYENWQDENARPEGGEGRLFLVHAVLAIARAKKNRDVDNQLIDCFVNHAKRRATTQVPECAIDRHTERGRQRGKGWDDFWNEGAKLYPEVEFPRSAEIRSRAIVALQCGQLPPDPKKLKTQGKMPSNEPGLLDEIREEP